MKSDFVEKRIIKTIIGEKQQEIITTELVERLTLLGRVCNYVFVRLRRAGKSYLMFQYIQSVVKPGKVTIKSILCINFEDERIPSTQMEELNLSPESYRELCEDRRSLIYLDEIQNIGGWEHSARRLAGSKYRIYATGSNAKMLSQDITTVLEGRSIIREVYPLPFSEYLTYKGVKLSENWGYSDERTTVAKLFDDYFHFSGSPETFDSRDKRNWIGSLYLKILLGDIIGRNKIRDVDAIRLLIKKMAEGITQPTALSRSQHIVSSVGAKVSRNMIADYIRYMKNVYLVFGISSFTDLLSDCEISRERYFCDNGLLDVFLVDLGTKSLEGTVALALMKRYGNEELSYYNKNVEMDSYLPSRKMTVQALFSISDNPTFKRETKVLVKTANSFDVEKFIIVTYDNERIVETAGILIDVVPVWEQLLNIEGSQAEMTVEKSSLTGVVSKLTTDCTD